MTIAPPMTSAVALDEYVVRVMFADGEIRDVDLSRFLDGPVFGPLRDWQLFRRVTIDPKSRTVTWPNGADLDPDVIYTPSLLDDDTILITVPVARSLTSPSFRPGPAKGSRHCSQVRSQIR